MKRSADFTKGTVEMKRKGRIHSYEVTSNSFHGSSEFKVRLKDFEGNFPYFRQPREISSFSLDSQREFHHDRSYLRLYVPPDNSRNVSFNLRDGYNCFIKRDETKKEHLDELLKCILLNVDKFQPNAAVVDQDVSNLNLFTDFISWRGLLTRLLCTPYENRDGWKIAVSLFNKTIYMCEFDTEQKIQSQANQSERQTEMTYWGYKFEQYVTRSDVEGARPDTTSPVNNNEAFCSMVRTRLEQHSLVYGGEVDCYQSVNGKQKYIELKTSREIETPNQDRNFKRFKLIKWWAQSFLIGIEKVIGGFRDDDGVVRRLETFNTLDMARMCKDLHNPWQPNVCFNFLNKFLGFLKRVVTEDDERVVYLFTWEPRSDIHFEKLPRSSEYCFLPEWYCSKLRRSLHQSATESQRD